MTSAPVGITLFRRPEYTRKMLEALSQCYGLDDRSVMISVDFDPRYSAEIEAVIQVALQVFERHPHVSVWEQKTKLGIDVHKEWLIGQLLANGHDRFIFLEDDVLPARDTLHYFDWALESYQANARVVSVCAYCKTDELNLAQLGLVYRAPVFVPWGWAMWADRWSEYWRNGEPYRQDVKSVFGSTDPNGHFDWWWLQLCQTHQLQTIFPCVARTQNFGSDQGEHTVPEVFALTDYNPVGAWQIENLPDRHEWTEMR